MVSFVTFSISRTVAATTLRQEATGSNYLERNGLTLELALLFCMRNPRAISYFSEIKRVKGSLRSRIPRAGALVRAVLI